MNHRTPYLPQVARSFGQAHGNVGNGRSALPETSRAPEQIPLIFALQSFMDSSFEAFTPPAQAVLTQPTNVGFVQSTIQEKQTPGFTVGLAPWSEFPLAVRFKSSGIAGTSTPLVLRPGEVLIPHGGPAGENTDRLINFSALDFGLPFGWLGGGMGTLYIFKTPASIPLWNTDRRELLFHRFRTVLRETSLVAPVPARVNWPTRFPWTQVFRGAGASSVDQRGQPVLSMEPTRTLMRLIGNVPTADITAQPEFRIVWWSTDDFDTAPDGLTLPAPAAAFTSYWQSNFPTDPIFVDDNPLIIVPPELGALASNTWGVTVEVPVGSPLAGQQVEFTRYGRL